MGQTRRHRHPIPKPQALCPAGVCGTIYIPPPRVTQTIPFLQNSVPTNLLPRAIKIPKFPLRRCRDGATLPAMRENPTPATGPVSIKHVRNTVPTPLEETTAPAVSSPTFVTMGSPSPKSIPSGTQLEEPSL